MAKKLPHTSKHRVAGKVVKVARIFDPDQIAARYHEQEMGEHSTPDHELHGSHETPDGSVTVEHIEGVPKYEEREQDGALVLVSGSPTVGPEFKLTWPTGASVTVPCADAVREYLGLTEA
jgi:hypothetical protein